MKVIYSPGVPEETRVAIDREFALWREAEREKTRHAAREAIRATQPIYAQIARIYARSGCVVSIDCDGEKCYVVNTLPPESQANVDELTQLADLAARQAISDCLNRGLPTIFY